MKSGDFLVYGNGERVEIVNFPTINGQPGVQVNDPNALFASDRFKLRSDVDKLVRAGVWRIEARATSKEEA